MKRFPTYILSKLFLIDLLFAKILLNPTKTKQRLGQLRNHPLVLTPFERFLPPAITLILLTFGRTVSTWKTSYNQQFFFFDKSDRTISSLTHMKLIYGEKFREIRIIGGYLRIERSHVIQKRYQVKLFSAGMPNLTY